MWRIKPVAGLLVGGFARANRLGQDALTPDPGAVAAIAASEAGIIDHCNRDHADAMTLLAGSEGDWRMVTCDVDGFDLALDERVMRIPWSAPMKDAGEVRTEFVRMTRAARGGRGSIVALPSQL